MILRDDKSTTRPSVRYIVYIVIGLVLICAKDCKMVKNTERQLHHQVSYRL